MRVRVHAMVLLSVPAYRLMILFAAAVIFLPVSSEVSFSQSVETAALGSFDEDAQWSHASLARAIAARQLAVEYAESDSSSFDSLSVAGFIGIVCFGGPISFSVAAPSLQGVACAASGGYTTSSQLSTVALTWCAKKSVGG